MAMQGRMGLAGSDSRRSVAMMCATIGVLPVPPTERLPTLITGRSRRVTA
jgi:hypothetical protein